MADDTTDNVTIPIAASDTAQIRTEYFASFHYQLVETLPILEIVAASAMTRPANTTPYTAGDAVSNNATAGSVTAISFTLADENDAPVTIHRCRIASTDTGAAGKAFRVYLYQ